jgi:copper chaperone NosL
MRWCGVFALLLFGVVIAGCQSRTDFDRPPEIRYGEDTCDQCRMIISGARFAAAYVTRQGTTRRFDGIGDLLLYYAAHAEEVAGFWVHDYDTKTWLKAEQAFFVVSLSLQTPMGHGVVAIRDQHRAEDLATSVHGMVMTFADLQKRFTGAEAASEHLSVHH